MTLLDETRTLKMTLLDETRTLKIPSAEVSGHTKATAHAEVSVHTNKKTRTEVYARIYTTAHTVMTVCLKGVCNTKKTAPYASARIQKIVR